ncbi:hypothetical protein CNR22_19870 [Sphingobacteriaceae bacterium]|nr:hypothetical protein CNR22_19870 [Sphingobacteriaceae bacterium]
MSDYQKIKRLALFFLPIVLFTINLVSKFIFLNYEDIGLDEPFTIYHAQFSLSTIIEQLKNYNNPPLYELILHVWIEVFGISSVSVRILPLIFASLCPVILYFFGKRFFSLQVGVVSSFLLSFSELSSYYSHDSRVYSLFLLLSLSSMYFFMELVRQEIQKVSTIAVFITLSSLLIYAHYFGIFILLFQGIYLLCFFRTKWIKFLFYYLTIAALYLPHLYPLLTRMGDSVKNGTWLQKPNGTESLYNMLWAFSNFPAITVALITIFVLSLAKLVITKDFFRLKKESIFIAVWFLFPFFGMFVISYFVPMYLSRYLIFALPAYYIIITLSINYLVRNVILKNFIFLAVIVSFSLSVNFRNNKKQKMQEATAFIKSNKGPNTAVIISQHDALLSLTYYYNRVYFASISDNREYHMMDSLMQRENVFVLSESVRESMTDAKNYTNIIYFKAGNNNEELERKFISDLKLTKTLTKQLSTTHQIWIFTKR